MKQVNKVAFIVCTFLMPLSLFSRGGSFGSSFGGSFLGGFSGSLIGNAISQPRQPRRCEYREPVVYQQPVQSRVVVHEVVHEVPIVEKRYTKRPKTKNTEPASTKAQERTTVEQRLNNLEAENERLKAELKQLKAEPKK